MASPYQQQALQRKLIYIGLIVVLFTVSGAFRAYVVEAKAEELSLREQNVGDVEVGGSALRLSLTGSRGFVVCALWNSAIDAQKKNRWNELELYVRSLTKLQPHFISPWLFQSWNLAYNVAVEADQVKDKYFYVTRGCELLAEGERQNRNHPDLRQQIGFYMQHKIGQSDETNVYRCLFQMSCIRPPDRDPDRFYTSDERGLTTFNMAEFEKFCQDHPQLVRRLRDKVRCNRPEDVVDFLRENQRVPGLYVDNREAAGAAWKQGEAPLKPVYERFPPLPPRRVVEPPQRRYDENDLDSEKLDLLDDSFDYGAAARAWYGYAIEPIPPTDPDRPGRAEDIRDRVRQRLPRMTVALFRNHAPRAASYSAERVEQEGWFDEDGWLITDWFPNNQFSSGKESRVGAGRKWGESFWDEARRVWEKHGKDNGLLLTAADEANKRNLAPKYWIARGLPINAEPLEADKNLKPGDELYDEYKAALWIHWMDYYNQLTNFKHHYYRALIEQEPQAVKARRAFFRAERDRTAGLKNKALAELEKPEGLAAWKQLLEKSEDFRTDPGLQEDSYEMQIKYVLLLLDLRSDLYRFALANAMSRFPPGVGNSWACLVAVRIQEKLIPEVYPSHERRLDVPPTGSKDGESMIRASIIQQVKVRYGLAKLEAPKEEDMIRMMQQRTAGGMPSPAPAPR